MGTKFSLKDKLQSLNGSNGLGKLHMAKAIYNFDVDGGAIGDIIPKQNVDIPDNAVIVGSEVNSTDALTSGGAATVDVGFSAGGNGDDILSAEAVASFSADAVFEGDIKFSAPVKLTAKANLQITVAAFALTAGVLEITVFYYTADA